MYSGSGSDLGLQMKDQEDNNKNNKLLFSRVVSKETSMANPSFHVDVTVAVPFIWESQPGTPKHNLFSQNNNNTTLLLPPLTPPPHYFSSINQKTNNSKKPSSRSNLLHILFSRIINHPKKTIITSSSSSSLSSSSFSSSFLPTTRKTRERRRFSSCGLSSSFDSRVYEYDHHHHQESPVFGSPTSTLCFGNIGATRRAKLGCYSWW